MKGVFCTVAETRGDKTVLRALGLGGYYGGGAQGMVDVKDGKILRVRPFHFDWKYDRENDQNLEAGKRRKDAGAYLEIASLSVLAGLQEARLLAQPDQVSADPRRLGSERGAESAEPRQEQVPPRLLGRSDHHHRQRIWCVCRRNTGTTAVLLQGDGHGECKIINTPHGHPGALLDHMGGFTLQVRNPDSWEGWYWGSKHVWGQGMQGNYCARAITSSRTRTENIARWCCSGVAIRRQRRGASPASSPAG